MYQKLIKANQQGELLMIILCLSSFLGSGCLIGHLRHVFKILCKARVMFSLFLQLLFILDSIVLLLAGDATG